MNPQTIRSYQRELKSIVPKQALQPATYKLVWMLGHVCFIFLNFYLIYSFDSKWILILSSVLVGISIACLFLFSHELSHGTIIRKRPWLYISELFFWAFSGFPPTVWKKVHNHTHHYTMNTPEDPDRKTFKSEKNIPNYIYNLLIYPNKVLKYSFSVGLAMVFYSCKHTLAALYPGKGKPSIVTAKPNYTRKERVRIIGEILYIMAFWGLLWMMLGFEKGILVIAMSWVTYSAFVISFIITQHLRNPSFQDIADPLLTSTSVIIPRWLDMLIDWHSYHVEHHIFPGINFDYYPEISKEIRNRYPEKYERMKFWSAFKECFERGVYVDDPVH